MSLRFSWNSSLDIFQIQWKLNTRSLDVNDTFIIIFNSMIKQKSLISDSHPGYQLSLLWHDNCLSWLCGGGGGKIHILKHTGMCSSNGSFFHKQSLHMGPIFYKKISLNTGLFFQILWKIEKVWRVFRKKSL